MRRVNLIVSGCFPELVTEWQSNVPIAGILADTAAITTGNRWIELPDKPALF